MNKQKQKKKYLKAVVRGLDHKMWDMDISIEGRKSIHEGVRQEYDRKKEIVDGARLRIEEEKKKGDKGDFELQKKLTSVIASHEPEIKMLGGQLKALDWDIDHEAEKITTGQMKAVIDGMKDLDKEFQTKVFKTLDVINGKDSGGLKQKKEATIEYQRLIMRMVEKL